MKCLLNVKKKMVEDEGYVLASAMMVLAILALLGAFMASTASVEVRIAANDRDVKENMYDQESCVMESRFAFRSWLTPAFFAAGETAAFFPSSSDVATSQCRTNSGDPVSGTYRVRKIEATGTPIDTWTDMSRFDNNAADHPANKFPRMAHIDKPDPVQLSKISVGETSAGVAAYDPKNFEIRRFAITSYPPANKGNTVVQQGVLKVLNKAS